MHIDINCLECGKGTLKYVLGKSFYTLLDIEGSVIIKKRVLCSKCKKDISDKKFAIRGSEFMIKLLAANMSGALGESCPKHLRGATAVNQSDYKMLKNSGKTRPTFVATFGTKRKAT